MLESGRLVYEVSVLLASAQCLLVSRTSRHFLRAHAHWFLKRMRMPSGYIPLKWYILNFFINWASDNS